MDKNIIVIKNLSKEFKHQKVLENITMKIPENCVYGLLGANGAGKSTLLKTMTGIIRPDSGGIFFRGHKWSRQDLSSIGALIETPPIYENLTAWENLKVKALLGNPKLLVLDEPINGLDPLGIQELRCLIRSFPQKGITVIVSSHILSEIQQTADYVGILANGRIGFEGRVDEQENLEELFMEIAAN